MSHVDNISDGAVDMEAVRAAMPEAREIDRVAELFDVMGDPTRARIICVLNSGHLCVADIAALLGMTSSAISHQLRILKQARMVVGRRDGKSMYYSLADQHIEALFTTALEHVAEGEEVE